jgi:hypothetical protein
MDDKVQRSKVYLGVSGGENTGNRGRPYLKGYD